MTRTQSPHVARAERLCRPQRVGVFGRRGVGKTTLLTMLYREAVGGRLPGLRLAAADARTADYLSDKVLQLEAGQPLPATLGETELRFHLYSQGTRHDLLVMDYQGEHVAVGREEPIRDFLRECDVVWLCLGVPVADTPADCLRAQQEVEQLVEDYLAAEASATHHRPMALVLTKADLLPAPDSDPGRRDELVARQFSMTRHALELHCPRHAFFAVSSLGGPMDSAAGVEPRPFDPRPAGLAGPLAWLAEVLRAQDEARLAQLWDLAAGDLALLERCVSCFARRYPDSPLAAGHRRGLRELRRRRARTRVLAGVGAVACLFLALWGYDAWGEEQARRFAAQHEDLVAVRDNWQTYRAWHPTRYLFRPASARAEDELLKDLDARIREQECADRLARLRRRAADPDADPEAVWQEFQGFESAFPDHPVDDDWQRFRAGVKARHDSERERRALVAFQELERAEQEGDLAALVGQANRFLRDHAGTRYEDAVGARRTAYLRRLDERAIEEARSYSARQPLNFRTREEHYRRYLERHPGGAFAREAADALRAIDTEWDRHDFRAVRDHYRDHPGDVSELTALCRSYLAAHPRGRFRSAADDLLRWVERVRAGGEYRVVLRRGHFDPRVAAYLSRGPSLSVLIAVNGVTYGPSTIVKRSYDPEWDYEFPRRVRWKLGDTVRVYVTDNYYWRRLVVSTGSADDDPLAMRLLSGEIAVDNTRLTFESDFTMPTLPNVE
jgi:hypothetical protein